MLWFRNRDGSFVDDFRAQELLNELAALFPADYPHWPGKLATRKPLPPDDKPLRHQGNHGDGTGGNTEGI